jgi:hypothetical protein
VFATSGCRRAARGSGSQLGGIEVKPGRIKGPFTLPEARRRLRLLPRRLACTPTDDVADKSASVNAKLQRRRQHCEELRRVGGLLTKLQASRAPQRTAVSCFFSP